MTSDITKAIFLFLVCVILPSCLLMLILLPVLPSGQTVEVKAEVEPVKENKKLLKLMDTVDVAQGAKVSLVRMYFEGPSNYYVDYIVVTESSGGCTILRR